MTTRLLVTGAHGFVGRAVVAAALNRGFTVRASGRRKSADQDERIELHHIGDLDNAQGWHGALAGVDVIVHCAGRAHMLNDSAVDPIAAFRRVNVEGTLHLARLAIEAGVKRFVFLSSIGVNGTSTLSGKSFSESDVPAPENAYGISKWEAEQALLKLAEGSSLEIVIIRPPLVYGPGAPGNFGALMRLVQRGWPLPLGAVRNRRSLVSLDNLVSFILTCAIHRGAANETFLVSDGEDISTTELVRTMGAAASVPARLVPVPVWMLRLGASIVGKGDAIQRLCGNLQLDISKGRKLLGWIPPSSVTGELRCIFKGKNKI